ncbi:MAG TPA: TolC family protein [Verrucomicrobiae bacterium]|jgi:outer membrane protein TolC|nr:TolC family protein [Verrucomicrobiae bacterium]
MNFSKISQTAFVCGAAAVALLFAGCKGVTQPGERAAREQMSSVASRYRPNGERPTLPSLTTNSPLKDFLTYAMLNQPQIEASYHDWAASVERITVERSLPDPKLTFQAYIQRTLTSIMPGLMQDFPGPGKLTAAGNVATAESAPKYFAFENSVLKTAFSVKQAYYQLWFLNEKIRISRQTLGVLSDLEKIAREENETGQATLQDVYRAQIERDRLATEIENLEDSRHSLTAQFKAALGLTREQPDPPQPVQFESTPLDLNGDALLDAAFARNPRLKAMEADVRLAEAQIGMARKSKVPDFSAGLQAEVYTPPFYWPSASMTLPIWRDKIAAQIAAAQANKHAAEARLTAEQIGVTVDFAMKTYEYREATRTVSLLQNKLIPKAKSSLELTRAAYLSGQVNFFNLMDAQRTLFNFQLEEVEARTRREIALAEISLSIAGVAPEGAPILSEANEPAPSSTVKTQPRNPHD